MQAIVSCSGQANSAKGCVGNYLHQKLGWKQVAFADNVKKLVCDLFNIDREFIEKWKRIDMPPPKFVKTMREVLIFIGEGSRQCYPDIWIDRLFQEHTENIIINDCRYISEHKAIKDKKGLQILIWRPNYENNIDSGSEQEIMPYVNQLKHHPEGKLENNAFDFWLINNQDLSSFYKKIDTLILPYIKKHFNM